MGIELPAAIIITGYLLGSIPTGFLVAKAKGIDIRKQGSGNIGATNVFRTLGKGPGIFVFVCDALKGVLAVHLAIILAHRIPSKEQILQQGDAIIHITRFLLPAIAGILGGVACILGHNFPVWLKFKGGKGVATSLGVVIGLAPIAAAVAFAAWAIVFFATRYVSLASIVGALVVPITVAFTTQGDERKALLLFTILAAILIVARHRANIERLANGTENRFEKKKK